MFLFFFFFRFFEVRELGGSGRVFLFLGCDGNFAIRWMARIDIIDIIIDGENWKNWKYSKSLVI